MLVLFSATVLVMRTVVPCSAAEAPPLPPRPSNLLFDDARLFNEEGAEQLSRALMDAEQSLGVSVFVTSISFLDGGSTLRDRVLPMLASWSAGRPGLLVAFNRGNSQFSVLPTSEIWQRYSTDEVALLITDAAKLLGNHVPPPDGRMKDAVSLILDRLQKLETQRSARMASPPAPSLRLMLGLCGACVVLGLLFWVLAARAKARSTGIYQPRVFPEAEVGTRLGAPFGGGVVGEASGHKG